MRRAVLSMSIAAVLATGCSNWTETTPSTSPSQPPADTTAPTARFTFPAMRAYTSAGTVRIVGTSSDDTAVTSVKVNGQDVTSTDSFATWTIDVTLADGSNTISLEAKDAAGNTATASTAIVRRAEIVNVSGGEPDATGEKIYFVDAGGKAIRMLNVADGAVSDVADISRFSPGLVPLDLALDLANNRIFLGVRQATNDGSSTVGVWAYDTQQRTWSAFSDATHPASGGGPALTNPSDLILDSARQKLYVVDWVNGVYSLSLATGARTVLSSNTVPSTTNALFSEPMDATLDGTAGKLYVVDRGTDAVFSVDVTSGARTLISRTGSQSGPSFVLPLSIARRSTDGQLYVFDGASSAGQAFLQVDPSTGVRSAFQTNAIVPQNGAQDLYTYDVRALVYANDALYAFDTGYQAVTKAEFSPNRRTRVTNNATPQNTDPRSSYASRIVNGKAWLATTADELVEVDASGAARVVAGASVTGSAALRAYQLAFDTQANVAYAVTYNGASQIAKVNLANGAITAVPDGTGSNGLTALPYLYDLVHDAQGNKVYGLTADGVVAIDLATGARSTWTSPASPSSAAVSSPRQMAFDRQGNRLLIADAARANLVAVDVATGAFTAFSESGASGPAFGSVYGVSVDASGNVWALDFVDRLYKVDRTTGARTDVSSRLPGGSGSGAATGYPWGAVRVEGNNVYVQDFSQSYLQVNAANGERVLVYRGANGNNN